MTIKSKVPTDKYREEWDRIFKPKFGEIGIKKEGTTVCRYCYFTPDKCICEIDRPTTYKEDQKH